MSNSPQADLALIKRRLFARYLTERDMPGVAGAPPLGADGSWPDLDYKAKPAIGFAPFPHLYRLASMARRYRGAPTRDAALGASIHAALDFWLRENPEAANWWYNSIGAPIEVGMVLVLMEDELRPEQLAGGLKILRRANDNGVLRFTAHGGSVATGQNLIWQATLQIVAGCLANDPAEVATFATMAAREISITRDEGIQADWSLHQHGPLLYNGGYGQGFARDCATLFTVLWGTAFAPPTAAVDTLSAYILDGCAWMVRGRTWDYLAIGRQIARPKQHANGLARACDDLAKLGVPRAAEFTALTRHLRGEPDAPPTAEGHRTFWRSDYVSHHRRGFHCGVRLCSTRTSGNEFGNGEGPNSYHLGHGAMCLLRTGEEYFDLYPLWHWRRLPGITALQADGPLPRNLWGNESRGTTPFAGGVSDGRDGAAILDFAKDGIRARKAWFFIEDEIVCLGTSLNTQGPVEPPPPFATTINQCRARANAPALVNGEPLPPGQTRRFADADTEARVLHDGVGYLIPGGQNLLVAHERRTGRWRDINDPAGSETPFTEDVFTLCLEHVPGQHKATYEYRILPGISAEGLRDHGRAPGPTVLSNTRDIQAVRHPALGLTQAIFLVGATLQPPEGPTLTADRGCALMFRENGQGATLSVSDPGQEGREIFVTIGRPLTGEDCERVGDGGATRVRFAFPPGEYAGQTIVRELKSV